MIGLNLLFQASCGAHADDSTSPAYWQWEPAPPMGWNSYDAYKDQVNEAQVMANARFMKDNLSVMDGIILSPISVGTIPNRKVTIFALGKRTGAKLATDEFG